MTCFIKDGYMESYFGFSKGRLYDINFMMVGGADVTNAMNLLNQAYGAKTCFTENGRSAWWIHPDAIVQGLLGRAIMENGQGTDKVDVHVWDPRYAPAHLPRPTKADLCK